jgi:hypothetical protein
VSEAESERKGFDDKKMEDKKIGSQRRHCPGTRRRRLFYFFVIPFFCPSLVADRAGSGAMPNGEKPLLVRAFARSSFHKAPGRRHQRAVRTGY